MRMLMSGGPEMKKEIVKRVKTSGVGMGVDAAKADDDKEYA